MPHKDKLSSFNILDSVRKSVMSFTVLLVNYSSIVAMTVKSTQGLHAYCTKVQSCC